MLVQRSIRAKKIIKHYGKVVQTGAGDRITIIIKTPSGKLVIIGSSLGVLSIINMENHRVVGQGVMDGHIGALVTTSDGAYLFAASNKDLFQFKIGTCENIKHFTFDANISSMVLSLDDKLLYLGNKWGNLLTIDITKDKFGPDYGCVLDNGIKTMLVTRDNKFLIVAGSAGDAEKPKEKHNVKKLSICQGRLVKHFGLLCENTVQSIQLGPGQNSLFAYDELCNLKQVKLTDDRALQ
jgi:hypothetical protein